MEQSIKASRLTLGEKILALSALALTFLFLPFDFSVLHPGYACVDEITVIGKLQRYYELGARYFHFLGGSLQHNSLILASQVLGKNLGSLHAAVMAAMGLQAVLLALVARRQFGERAAVWSLAACFLAALSLMQGRSLLSFTAAPAELLALWALFPSGGGTFPCAAWGLGCGLLLLDYDIWGMGAPLAMALAFWNLEGKAGRPSLLTGFAIGAAFSVGVSWGSVESAIAMRKTKALPSAAAAGGQLWLHLSEYWLGGPCFAYIGVPGRPSFPVWAWPGLLAGAAACWKQTRLLVLGVGFALLPLFFRSPGLEPHRAILAWPLLALIAGSGFSWIWEKLPRRLAPLLLLLPFVGGFSELRAYRANLDAQSGLYADSLARRDMLAELSREEALRPLNVLSYFDMHESSAARYLMGPRGPRPEAAPCALVLPWYGLPAIYGMDGELRRFGASAGREAYLFFPGPRSAPRLRRLNGELKNIWSSLPYTDQHLARATALELLLKKSSSSDPWLRAVLWKEYLESLHYTGQLQDRHIEALLAERLPIAEPFRETALREGRQRPALGIRLMERSAAIDPRLAFTPELRAPLEYYQELEKRGAER